MNTTRHRIANPPSAGMDVNGNSLISFNSESPVIEATLVIEKKQFTASVKAAGVSSAVISLLNLALFSLYIKHEKLYRS